MKKTAIALAVIALLSGCATFETFSNRIVCTVAKDEAYVVSKWGAFGISTPLHEKDKELICK